MSSDLAADEVFCRDCGSVIKERAEICPECGIRQREPESSKSEKNPGVAAVASFIIPGLGQVYNGQIAKGIILGAVTIGFAITIVGLILAFPLWVWLIYDAYKVAESGGASGSGGATAAPRTAIEQALAKRIDEADDPSMTKAVQKRFWGTNSRDLSAADKEFIIDTVEMYDREALPDVREALRK